MRVLVTGGAGYIGSHTLRLLLDRGHDCVVLDSLERGWAEAVDPRARLVVGSVGDAEAVDDALEGCEAVIHLAGYIDVAESIGAPDRYRDNNFLAPLALLQGMAARGVSSLVFSSTAAVYGEPVHLPILESDPTEPVNPYGESKLAFEHSVADAQADGIRSVVFRYFNVAGAWPGGEIGEAHEPETHIIPGILRALRQGGARFEVFGTDFPTPDGTCIRDYIHVLDIAEAHVAALGHLAAGKDGGVFNLGNGAGFSNLEVVRACGEVTGQAIEVVDGPRRMGDPAVLVASAAKAKDELGWVARRPVLEGMIQDAWAWHLAHPDGYR